MNFPCDHLSLAEKIPYWKENYDWIDFPEIRISDCVGECFAGATANEQNTDPRKNFFDFAKAIWISCWIPIPLRLQFFGVEDRTWL